MESPAGIVFAHTSFRCRIETILDTGRRQLINRFPRFKLFVFILLVVFTFAAAASAPAITAIEEAAPIDDDTGSELHQSFNRLEPDMTRVEVEAILGPPDDSVEVKGRANLALVWKQKKFLVTTETVVVALRDDDVVMLTHSSGPILNVRKHVEEALAGDTGLALSEAQHRRLEEIERFQHIYEMRTDVAAMLNHPQVDGEEYFEVDPENAARFDSMELGTSYDSAVARFGEPKNVDLRWSKTYAAWHWNGDTAILRFEDHLLTAKTFKTADREAVVEEGQWQASAGRTRVTVIED